MNATFRMHWRLKHSTGRRNWGRAVSLVTGVCALAVLLATAPTGLAQCVAPPTGTMVAWYPFEDPGGYSYNLATGNTGVWSSSPPTIVTGMVGNALLFNGVDNYIDAADSIATNFGPAGTTPCSGGDFSSCAGDFSIDAWVNLPQQPGLPMPIVDKRGTGPIGYEFYINANRIGVQLADGTGAVGYDNYDSPGLRFTTGAWHHVAVTVKRSSAIRFYFDGAVKGSVLPSHTGSLVNNGILRIGANGPANPGGSVFFNGTIDELEIYNRVLTGAEIQAIFLAGTNGKCKP